MRTFDDRRFTNPTCGRHTSMPQGLAIAVSISVCTRAYKASADEPDDAISLVPPNKLTHSTRRPSGTRSPHPRSAPNISGQGMAATNSPNTNRPTRYGCQAPDHGDSMRLFDVRQPGDASSRRTATLAIGRSQPTKVCKPTRKVRLPRSTVSTRPANPTLAPTRRLGKEHI